MEVDFDGVGLGVNGLGGRGDETGIVFAWLVVGCCS